MRLALRRMIFQGCLLAASVATLWYYPAFAASRPHLVYLTGWGLLALMLYLTAYNARKKLPFLPLVSSRAWLQMHVYLGLFTGLVFLLHLRWHWPQGGFEATLALLFVGVTASGLLGWWLSNTMPKRLTTAGGEVPFERIPVIRRSLQLQAEKLVLTGIVPAGADTLADFYAARLAGFFSGPANFGAHLLGSRRPLNRLLSQLAEVDRFINATEKKTVAELVELVRQKDSLDFHRTAQLMLKGWLFVHIPLTYGLLVFSVVHVVIVYAFSGGAR
ncbi:MAG: hypothetical protein HY302_12220 [Opitutae bacterium]|nr:hypothetical protein [Opitutae bacterium]